MPGVERWSLYRSLWNRYAHEFIVTYSKRFGTRWGGLSVENKGELKKLIECVFPVCDGRGLAPKRSRALQRGRG